MIRSVSTLLFVLSVASCGGAGPLDPAETGANPTPDPEVILEGTVRRFTTDQLLGGVTILADQAEATSTGKGGYVFAGLGEGEVQIRATYPGFLPYEAKQRLQPGRNRHDIDLVPERQR